MNGKRIWLKPYRPNLHWAELLLDESLQAAFVAPGYGSARPLRDTSVIPLGEFCYDFESMRRREYVPCRYFKYTGHGSVKCIYLGIEASDGIGRKLAKHFGSRAKVQAAGVIDTWTLPDSIKECGVNMLFPTTLASLQSAVDDYEQAVLGKRVNLWTKPYPERASYEESKLRTIALDRLGIWKCLCSMVQDVPASLIFRLQLIDAMHRGHTQPSSTLIDSGYAGELAHHPEPQRQFWYMYRTHFYDISMNWKEVCWLENRERIAELYYYDQRVAAIIALREASEKTV